MNKYMGEGSYPRYGKHVVRVLLQDGEYQGYIVLEMGGNCKGGSILTSVISTIEDNEFEPNMIYADNLRHIVTDGDGFPREYVLFDKNEEELYIDADEDFIDCVVGVEIVDFIDDPKSVD
ncbi:DUF5406 family protein [Paenibacillus sp. GYB003]|uniref:DUF5406 family protein n=1 Tax=Paenibacillus sp. GYB003 TaxID=2994392 RepID=UPI002F96A150